MGRVRPKYIKNMASTLVEKKEFSPDFEENKKILAELGLIESKMLRNRVAGYIVRIVKNKRY